MSRVERRLVGRACPVPQIWMGNPWGTCAKSPSERSPKSGGKTRVRPLENQADNPASAIVLHFCIVVPCATRHGGAKEVTVLSSILAPPVEDGCNLAVQEGRAAGRGPRRGGAKARRGDGVGGDMAGQHRIALADKAWGPSIRTVRAEPEAELQGRRARRADDTHGCDHGRGAMPANRRPWLSGPIPLMPSPEAPRTGIRRVHASFDGPVKTASRQQVVSCRSDLQPDVVVRCPIDQRPENLPGGAVDHESLLRCPVTGIGGGGEIDAELVGRGAG